MGKEYLVNGAKLMCLCGEGTSELRVTKEHGYRMNNGMLTCKKWFGKVEVEITL